MVRTKFEGGGGTTFSTADVTISQVLNLPNAHLGRCKEPASTQRIQAPASMHHPDPESDKAIKKKRENVQTNFLC